MPYLANELVYPSLDEGYRVASKTFDKKTRSYVRGASLTGKKLLKDIGSEDYSDVLTEGSSDILNLARNRILDCQTRPIYDTSDSRVDVSDENRTQTSNFNTNNHYSGRAVIGANHCGSMFGCLSCTSQAYSNFDVITATFISEAVSKDGFSVVRFKAHGVFKHSLEEFEALRLESEVMADAMQQTYNDFASRKMSRLSKRGFSWRQIAKETPHVTGVYTTYYNETTLGFKFEVEGYLVIPKGKESEVKAHFAQLYTRKYKLAVKHLDKKGIFAENWISEFKGIEYPDGDVDKTAYYMKRFADKDHIGVIYPFTESVRSLRLMNPDYLGWVTLPELMKRAQRQNGATDERIARIRRIYARSLCLISSSKGYSNNGRERVGAIIKQYSHTFDKYFFESYTPDYISFTTKSGRPISKSMLNYQITKQIIAYERKKEYKEGCRGFNDYVSSDVSSLNLTETDEDLTSVQITSNEVISDVSHNTIEVNSIDILESPQSQYLTFSDNSNSEDTVEDDSATQAVSEVLRSFFSYIPKMKDFEKSFMSEPSKWFAIKDERLLSLDTFRVQEDSDDYLSFSKLYKSSKKFNFSFSDADIDDNSIQDMFTSAKATDATSSEIHEKLMKLNTRKGLLMQRNYFMFIIYQKIQKDITAGDIIDSTLIQEYIDKCFSTVDFLNAIRVVLISILEHGIDFLKTFLLTVYPIANNYVFLHRVIKDSNATYIIQLKQSEYAEFLAVNVFAKTDSEDVWNYYNFYSDLNNFKNLINNSITESDYFMTNQYVELGQISLNRVEVSDDVISMNLNPIALVELTKPHVSNIVSPLYSDWLRYRALIQSDPFYAEHPFDTTKINFVYNPYLAESSVIVGVCPEGYAEVPEGCEVVNKVYLVRTRKYAYRKYALMSDESYITNMEESARRGYVEYTYLPITIIDIMNNTQALNWYGSKSKAVKSFLKSYEVEGIKGVYRFFKRFNLPAVYVNVNTNLNPTNLFNPIIWDSSYLIGCVDTIYNDKIYFDTLLHNEDKLDVSLVQTSDTVNEKIEPYVLNKLNKILSFDLPTLESIGYSSEYYSPLAAYIKSLSPSAFRKLITVVDMRFLAIGRFISHDKLKFLYKVFNSIFYSYFNKRKDKNADSVFYSYMSDYTVPVLKDSTSSSYISITKSSGKHYNFRDSYSGSEYNYRADMQIGSSIKTYCEKAFNVYKSLHNEDFDYYSYTRYFDVAAEISLTTEDSAPTDFDMDIGAEAIIKQRYDHFVKCKQKYSKLSDEDFLKKITILGFFPEEASEFLSVYYQDISFEAAVDEIACVWYLDRVSVYVAKPQDPRRAEIEACKLMLCNLYDKGSDDYNKVLAGLDAELRALDEESTTGTEDKELDIKEEESTTGTEDKELDIKEEESTAGTEDKELDIKEEESTAGTEDKELDIKEEESTAGTEDKELDIKDIDIIIRKLYEQFLQAQSYFQHVLYIHGIALQGALIALCGTDFIYNKFTQVSKSQISMEAAIREITDDVSSMSKLREKYNFDLQVEERLVSNKQLLQDLGSSQQTVSETSDKLAETGTEETDSTTEELTDSVQSEQFAETVTEELNDIETVIRQRYEKFVEIRQKHIDSGLTNIDLYGQMVSEGFLDIEVIEYSSVCFNRKSLDSVVTYLQRLNVANKLKSLQVKFNTNEDDAKAKEESVDYATIIRQRYEKFAVARQRYISLGFNNMCLGSKLISDGFTNLECTEFTSVCFNRKSLDSVVNFLKMTKSYTAELDSKLSKTSQATAPVASESTPVFTPSVSSSVYDAKYYYNKYDAYRSYIDSGLRYGQPGYLLKSRLSKNDIYSKEHELFWQVYERKLSLDEAVRRLMHS